MAVSPEFYLLSPEVQTDILVWRSVQDKPCVYFLAFDRFVKIGWTRDVSRRLGELNIFPGPIRLLYAHQGTLSDERKYHCAKFKSLRVHNEWFRHERHLATFIAARRKKLLDAGP